MRAMAADVAILSLSGCRAAMMFCPCKYWCNLSLVGVDRSPEPPQLLVGVAISLDAHASPPTPESDVAENTELQPLLVCLEPCLFLCAWRERERESSQYIPTITSTQSLTW